MCGPATLVMVLNAFGMDPGKLWKGPWRWYHEQSLECCKPPEDIAREGLDWEEWLCLARCQGLEVESRRADEQEQSSGMEDFEVHCAAVCSVASGAAMALSYSRQVVGQAGDGHYSPIGAYHRGRSHVLVLDTARFKYPPHWLPVSVLWEAMRAINTSTGRSRGYAILRNGDAIAPSSCFSLKLTWRAWNTLASWTTEDLPSLTSALQESTEAAAEAELWALVRGLPPAVASLLSVSEATPNEPPAPAFIADPVDLGELEVTSTDSPSPRYCDRGARVKRALHRTHPYATLEAARQKRPKQSTLPNSMEAIVLLVLLLGELGLLDDSLPHARAAELWKWHPRSDDEDDLALQEELKWLVLKAQEVRNAVAAHDSCCCFHATEDLEESPHADCSCQGKL